MGAADVIKIVASRLASPELGRNSAWSRIRRSMAAVLVKLGVGH